MHDLFLAECDLKLVTLAPAPIHSQPSILTLMSSQQPVEVHHDSQWEFDDNTRRIVHSSCDVCKRYIDHYPETASRSRSFNAASEAEIDKICDTLQPKLFELEAVCKDWETTRDILLKEIEEAGRELEAIQMETFRSSQELERLLQELKEVQEVTASSRREQTGLLDKVSGLALQSYGSQSPRKVAGHTRTPHIVETDGDSDIEIISPPS